MSESFHTAVLGESPGSHATAFALDAGGPICCRRQSTDATLRTGSRPNASQRPFVGPSSRSRSIWTVAPLVSRFLVRAISGAAT